MYTGRLIFSQVMDYLPKHIFRQCVNRYQGNRKIKNFTCLDQFLCVGYYLNRHHYLDFNRTVGENIKYLIRDQSGHDIACLLFGSAAWQVEVFFKWIKHNLKIKTFLGTSRNAVMTQIWVALITMLDRHFRVLRQDFTNRACV